MLRYFITFFILVNIACFGEAQNLSLKEQSALETFIATLLEQTEAGYVILKQKPICVEAFFSKDPLPVNSATHKQSVALRAGACIWKDLVNSPSDTIIHVCDKEDPLIPGYIHILVINVPLFHQVVNENLALFQYGLGPAVTSQALLDALLSNRQTFYSLFKGDKALIGVVLGYGEQNSLYIGRKENIQEGLDEQVPPFLSNASIRQEYSDEFLPLAPSFGFTSVSEELSSLEKRTASSSSKLITQSPQFFFGWVKGASNSQKISELEAAQDVISKSLMSSPLEQILPKLGKTKYISRKTSSDFPTSEHDVNELMALTIWNVLQKYDADYFPYFLEGMEQTQKLPNVERLARFPDYRRNFLEAKTHLQEADRFFEALKTNENFQNLVPSKLFYRVVKNGQGETKCKGCYLSLNYSIFSPQDQCLATEANVVVNLKNTIPGFALGVKGMQLGETREILIHPTLAYGFDTSLDKCAYLRAVVTLHDIRDNHEFFVTTPSLNLDFLKDDGELKKIETNYMAAISERAMDISNYLKNSNKLNPSLIEKHLQSYHNSRDVPRSLTEAEQELVNKVHWDVYFNSEAWNRGLEK